MPGVADTIFLRRLKAVSDLYLYSNLHMTLCGVAMVHVTQSFFGYALRLELFVFVFCGTFFLYNLQRLPSAFDKNIQRRFSRHSWNTKHRVLLSVTSAFAAIAAGWSFFQLYPRTQVVALLPAALSFAYAFPLLPAKGKWKRLREIPVLKIFIVALVWAMIIALLPAAANDETGLQVFSPEVLTWSAAITLMIFALTVPFDIRDLHYDGEKLRTIPALVGVKKAIAIALAALALSAAGVVVLHAVYEVGTTAQVIVYAIWCVITGILISRSTPERHEYYFSLVLDGMLIVLWGMVAACGFVAGHL